MKKRPKEALKSPTTDVARITGKLMSRGFRRGERRDGKSGLYVILIDESRLLYVGMTSPKRRSSVRDHFDCDHSGGSTVRRSLGALLKEKLPPCLRAIRRSSGPSPTNWRNYRFQGEGEAALTQWMKQHLCTNFVELVGERKTVRRREIEVIKRLMPPLNLTDWENSQGATIKRLRKLCTNEARHS